MIAILLVTSFALLSILHFYWAAGGRGGHIAVLPTWPAEPGATAAPKPALNPGTWATLGVATGLAAIALAVALRVGLLGEPVDHWVLRWILIALAALMFARAVGDFRFVGFFKSVRGTVFARADNLVYSPLCLAFGAGLAEVAGF
ncbi:MAG: DUF3995 domain-containing protein [Rhodocyclales bacterium]|nr:DUF3995 domain-containing protein [Rhodocyclales bacterium]